MALLVSSNLILTMLWMTSAGRAGVIQNYSQQHLCERLESGAALLFAGPWVLQPKTPAVVIRPVAFGFPYNQQIDAVVIRWVWFILLLFWIHGYNLMMVVTGGSASRMYQRVQVDGLSSPRREGRAGDDKPSGPMQDRYGIVLLG